MAAAQAGAQKARVRLVFSHTPSTGPIWPFQGFDFEPRKKEIAETLSRPAGTIKTWIRRARLELVARLRRRDVVQESPHAMRRN